MIAAAASPVPTGDGGKRTRRHREALGLTRTDLVAAIALAGRRARRDDIRHCEEGTSSPRIETLERLEQRLRERAGM